MTARDIIAGAVPRRAFIEAYAKRSGLDASTAELGFLEIGRDILIALPCACEDKNCEGWALVAPSLVPSHLELYAPEPIRTAFSAAVEGRAAGYRILAPGELDGETLERAAREAERLLVFADTTSHADKAIASSIRALRESG